MRAPERINFTCHFHRPPAQGWLDSFWVRLTSERVDSVKGLPSTQKQPPQIHGGPVPFLFCLTMRSGWPAHLISWLGMGIYTISSPGFQAFGLGQEHDATFPYRFGDPPASVNTEQNQSPCVRVCVLWVLRPWRTLPSTAPLHWLVMLPWYRH